MPAKFYDGDVERQLVGAALIDPALFASSVSPNDFYLEELRAVWQAGADLVAAGKSADAVTVADELERRGHPMRSSTLLRLLNECASPGCHGTWAATLQAYARRRRLFGVLRAALVGVQGDADPAALAAATIGELNEIQRSWQPKSPTPKTFWTAAELLAADFPCPQWAVPELIPAGVTFLAGRPKVGKSWLALQVAIAVGSGGEILGRQVVPGKALYLAFEDYGRRLQQRAARQAMPADAALHLAVSWPPFDRSGLVELESAIEQEGYTLVVVDTLSRAIGRADQQDLAEMTGVVGALQGIALAHSMAILLVDHHRKPSGFTQDPIDDIVGSTAKSAVADAALGLFREPGKKAARLKVTGRDVEWQEIALEWDADSCRWQLEGKAGDGIRPRNKEKVLGVLAASPEEGATLTELAEGTGIGKNNLGPILNVLIRQGSVRQLPMRGHHAVYGLAAPPMDLGK